MFEVARYDSERRITPSFIVALAAAAFVGFYISAAPDLLAEMDLDDVFAGLSPEIIELFNLHVIDTIEGYLASQFYIFGWVVLVGSYIAYSAAGSLAGRIDDGRIEMVLATRISRRQVLFEKYLSLLIPITVVNLTVATTVYLGTNLIGYQIAAGDLLAVHAFSVPYFLCCGAIGILCSVLAQNRTTAEIASVSLILVGYVIDVATDLTEFAWLGAVSPTRYYEPVDLLALGTYDFTGAIILLVLSLVLIGVSQLWFNRVDLQ